MVTEAQKRYIVDELRAHFRGLRAVYLFGSQVQDGGIHATEDSDFDVAYLSDATSEPDAWGTFNLQVDMARALNTRWVDLVDIGTEREPTLTENVLAGERLWAADLVEVETWELGRLAVARDYRFRHREQWAEEMADIRARVDEYRKAKNLEPRAVSRQG